VALALWRVFAPKGRESISMPEEALASSEMKEVSISPSPGKPTQGRGDTVITIATPRLSSGEIPHAEGLMDEETKTVSRLPP